jgi:hypothetical protein
VIESLRRRADRFGLDVILINVWEGAEASEDVARYCQMWDIEGTVLLDEEATFTRTLGVRGVPTNVFVDEQGIVRAFGASSSEELLRHAAALEPRLSEGMDEALGASRIARGFASDQESR